MKKIFTLLLLGGLLFVGAGNAWAVVYETMVARGDFEGASWDAGKTMTRLTENTNIWVLDYTPTEDATLNFKFAETNDNWTNSWGAAESGTKALDTDYSTSQTNNIVINLTGGTTYRFALNTATNTFCISEATTSTIYFYNTLGWTNVYVNLIHSAYWRTENPKGSGASGKTLSGLQMTRIGETNYWKYEFKGNSSYVSFTEHKQDGYNAFYNTEAVYRGDFNSSVPVYIPCTVNNDEQNGTKYYSNGVWIGYDATSFSRSIATGSYGTICSPVDATITGATLYTVEGVNAAKTILYIAAETGDAATNLTAGVPYFYKATANTQTITLTGSSYASSPSTATNGVYGTYAETSIVADNNYCVLSSNTLLNVTTSGVKVKANRTYIKKDAINESSGTAPERPIIAMPLEVDNTTNLEAFEASDKAVKFFQNGNLYILRDGVTYDATGRIVK